MAQLTVDVARKVMEVVDAGLCKGVGKPNPGEMCVEAAVCYALREPHGDNPSCVGAAVRAYKIVLNDANWSSNAARSEGLREIAIAQLGSVDIDQVKFSEYVALEIIRQVLPSALRGVGLDVEAEACEKAVDLSAAESAAWSAAWSAARSAESAAESAARSAARSAAWSAALSAESAESAAMSAAMSAESAARSAAEKRDSIYRLAAKIGVSALRHCACVGVEFLDELLA
jgi:hypothetical protein